MKLQKISIIIKKLALFSIGILILIFWIYRIGADEFFSSFSKIKVLYLVPIILLLSISWFLRTLRISNITKTLGAKIKMLDLYQIHIGGFALNVILPAKLGDVATALALKKYFTFIKSIATIIHTRVLDIIALIIFITIGIIFIDAPFWIITTTFILSVIIIIGISIVILLNRMRIKISLYKKLEKTFLNKLIEKSKESSSGFFESYNELLNPKPMAINIFISCGILLMEALVCYYVAIALGSKISLEIIIFAVSCANIAKGVPITPGSIGIYETALASLLIFLGVDESIAFTIALSDHLIKNGYILIIGAPLSSKIGLNIMAKKDEIQKEGLIPNNMETSDVETKTKQDNIEDNEKKVD